MSVDQFRNAAMEALRKVYDPDRSDEEIDEAMEEYQDIIDDSFEEAQSPESFCYDWHASNAADNIAMCCF